MRAFYVEFKLRYEEVSVGCGGLLQITEENKVY